jgi:serine/threonine protein kinase/tetratricopeptide (TPR) repeat protein
MMNRAREERLEQLFDEALALPPELRAAFLDGACDADPELRVTLAALVADAGDAYAFGDRVLGPAVVQVASVLLGDSHPSADDAEDALLGQQIAHFQIVEKLGGGGMGLVYKALDLRLDRTVALKVLPSRLGEDEEAKRRFGHEAKAASALDHPNICAVHEIGQTESGRLFIAMAYCEGETLKQKITRGPLPVSQALEYAAQVAGALQRAHEAGIVHRDVKPANVIVTDSGAAKIVDFGLAKMAGTAVTREGITIGTVAYMSPEQTRGDAVDARSDIWSLGAVLYEMLAGQRPFRSESDETLIYAIRHDEPKSIREVRAEIPGGLDAVVSRCLEKEPARRYQRADELLADLRTMQKGGAVRRPLSRRRVLRYASAGVVLIALLILSGVALRSRPEARVHSLAVLPVTAFTGDSAKDALSDGMTDMLITHLSQLSGLRRVISRTSVAQYRNTQKSSRQIGRELGVDALVEMSVIREGERVRMTVTLVRAETERVLWSRSFERPMRDALTLQGEIVQAIAQELQVRLTPQEAAHLTQAAPEVNPEAFALYLQGSRVKQNAPLAIAYFEKAIEKDSAFALAYAAVALPYVFAGNKAQAERAIAKALSLDPSLSEAYAALGLLRMWIDWDWTAAEAALRRAISLNAHDAHAHHELGQLFMRLDRCDEAIAEEQRAVLSEPGYYQSGIGEVYLYCRRYDEALHEFEKTLDVVIDPFNVYQNLGDTYFYQGQYQKALTMYQKTWWVPGWAYGPLGGRSETLQQISDLKDKWARDETKRHIPFYLARLYASLGERAEAITWLERAYEKRHGIVVYLKVHPQFDSLRSEPRFQSLLRRIGL